MNDLNFVLSVLFILVILQSIVGVGILVIGTPFLLILGFDIVATISILLPISIATSFINLIFFKINKKKFFPFIILRLYQVYGPYQKALRLLPFVIKSCLANKKFKTTSGNQYRDFVHVDDLNDLIIKIINSNIKNEIFNVGSGKPIKIRKLIERINKIIGKGKPIFGGLNMRKDESLNLFPNIKKVRKFFTWKPKIDLDSGLKKTIKYYKKEIS